MSKHTPGPWSLRQESQGRERAPYIDVCVADRSSEHFGSVASVSAGMSPKARANARLIAAAPDLLAACAALVAARDGLVSGIADRTDHAAALARAALAKAGGN